MDTETFADYILSEKDWIKKMEIVITLCLQLLYFAIVRNQKMRKI